MTLAYDGAEDDVIGPSLAATSVSRRRGECRRPGYAQGRWPGDFVGNGGWTEATKAKGARLAGASPLAFRP